VQATGYNVVDCDAAKKRGVTVCNVPAYGTNAVAQFTFSLLLEICNQVGHHNNAVHAGRWSECGNFCFWDTPQMELHGKTLGIIGYGSIGQAVGRIAKAFGMKVLAYSRTRYPEFQDDYADLNAVLSRSDIITLHCPMTPETDRIINKDTIAKMKDGAILINTGRGQLVDEQAVADALVSGKLRAMAADVVSAEPITPDNPLLSAPNCILTPHMAWTPVEARQRIIDITANSIRGYLSGNIVNAVN
jgi:glycerate dehydrogenase